MRKAIVILYIALLSVISGIIVAAQILSIAKLYYPLAVILTSLLISCIFGVLLTKLSYQFILNSFEGQNRQHLPRWLSCIISLSGILILLVVLFLPLLLWPYSGINHELNWDAGFYHFPKAAEMVVTHSSWDLSIAYGEYPFGFESLIAASLVINRAGYLIGAVHAIILLFFIMTLFLLVNRYSNIPSPYIFFSVVAITASYDIIRFTSLNPFQIFRVLAFTIGKNDFFLASAMLALIYFAPIGPKHPAYDLFGLGLTSMIVCSTKPNGFLLCGFVWALALFLQIKEWKAQKQITKNRLLLWAGVIFINVIGVLWAIRNLIAQGTLFSKDSLSLQKLSIVSNLSNPLFYKALGLIALMILVLFLGTIIMSALSKQRNWSIPITFAILLVSFAVTPAVLFFGSGKDASVIFWRLGFYLLAFEIPVIFYLCDKVFTWLINPGQKAVNLLVNSGIALVIVVISISASMQNYSRIIPNAANTLVLRDQYTSSVGTNGYFSAYDYIRRNVTNSVVWIENGLPFYLYGDQMTNSVTRSRQPDYRVFLQTNWIGNSGYPAMLNSADWKSKWDLVYQDSEGKVYKRKTTQ
jgi:hypothetical protein